jgi:hypothetical protein
MCRSQSAQRDAPLAAGLGKTERAALGQDNREIYEGLLGMTEETYAALQKKKVF